MIDTVTGICWGEGSPRDVAQRRVNEQIGLELTMEDHIARLAKETSAQMPAIDTAMRIDKYAITLGITDYDSTNARSAPVLYRGVKNVY